MSLNITNLINNESFPKMNCDFNSAELNFQQKHYDDELQSYQDNVSEQKIIKQTKYQSMLKEMFSLLAQQQNVQSVISAMIKKYGSFFDKNAINVCEKLGDLIGNYFITCKYNDNLGQKNPKLVKYVIMCDCPQEQIVQENYGDGSVDGFFNQKQNKISKVHICHKHNLPVISSFDDLTEQEFSTLAKEISEIKNIPIKQVKKNTQGKNVVSKIARAFKNISLKKSNIQNKIDTQKYEMKDANIQVKADLSQEFESADIKQVEAPKGEKMSYDLSQEFEQNQVNVPVNTVTINIEEKEQSLPLFTISPQKCKDVSLTNNLKSNVNIPSKNIEIAVQKESKFIDNISIYTKPIKTEFDLSDDYILDVNKCEDDNIQIDLKNSFDF